MTDLTLTTIEVPVAGMDCAHCARSVQDALTALPGVRSADVLLSSEKAIVTLDPARVGLPAIRDAVVRAGYAVPDAPATGTLPGADGGFAREVLRLFGVVVGAVLAIVVIGEWLGLFEQLTERVPFPIGVLLVAALGWPVFRNVIRATLRGQVVAHTVMTVGVLAALAVGQWATAAVVVFFMRVGDYAERFTTERGRRAVRDLTALAPQTARIERDGEEVEVPVAEVAIGQVVVVHPGEAIPVDGEIVTGQATVNQATITGESMPVEVGPGDHVFAATLATLGTLRVRATKVGRDTTFGRVITLVEEAETHRSDVQRLADRFSGWFLPVVVTVAAVAFLLSRNPLAVAAVLVVACSCSLALATPIAMLATIGAAAKEGILIKGGKHIETLARADVLLVDKTGTLTIGRPRLTDVIPLNGVSADHALALAATAERHSEHPLAEAVRQAARDRGVHLGEPESFAAVPGLGVRARVDGHEVTVGSPRLVPRAEALPEREALEAAGKTMLVVTRDGEPVALLAAADTVRPEVAVALAEVRRMGIDRIELLTGDNPASAAAVAGPLGIGYRADLLPEDKIAIVRAEQARGHTVVMVGDGVNDAPALAQADVGVAMGAAGSDVAIEAAHVALMRDDWRQVPHLFALSRRTMRVVRLNLGFTAVYNVVGISLAALGVLPPVLAAAAQSIPDLGIMANSARLLRPPRAR